MQNFLNDKIKFYITFVIIVVFLILFIFSSDYSLQEINELAYVVAIGLDTCDSNNLNLSIQISDPNDVNSSNSSSSSSSMGSSSEQTSSSIVYSVECSSIQEGINLFYNFISRNINLSHCKVIVLSEELATKDISRYLLDLTNNIEISNQANIMITKCDANTYLKMTNPILESFTARYYNIVNNSSKTTAYTHGITLMDFFSTYTSDFQEPVSVLSNINTEETHSNSTSGSYLNKDNSYVAGQTPITSVNNVENMGLAIFKSGKFVGELNASESICHMIVSSELNYATIQIQDSEDETKAVDIKISLKNKPKIKLKLINGSPYITLDIKINSQVISVNSTNNYLSDENITSLEQNTNEYLKEIISNYLYKVSKVYNSDIDGFGRYAMKYFLTTDKWNEYNWLDNFGNSFFNVNVETEITSSTNFISG